MTLESCIVACPYCGECFETSVDCSAGDCSYIEDCYVCCRPIVFDVVTNGDGGLSKLTTRREDE